MSLLKIYNEIKQLCYRIPPVPDDGFIIVGGGGGGGGGSEDITDDTTDNFFEVQKSIPEKHGI
jgi:hypothetical protein